MNNPSIKSLLSSEHVLCIDNSGAEDKLNLRQPYPIDDVMLDTKTNTLNFKLANAGDTYYDGRRFKPFVFSAN